MTVLLRRLNADGLAAWRSWCEDKERGAPPRHLLDDPAASEEMEPALALVPPALATRFEVGRWLETTLAPLDAAQIRNDAGLWDWLSLRLLDLVCPPDAAGHHKLGEPVRYALSTNFQKRTRPLIRTAWFLVREHGENARFMLAGGPDTHGALVDDLTNRQEVIGSKALIGVAARLYGHGASGPTNRKRGGTVRRLVSVAAQLRLTWDLDSMQPDQIVALLPREFDRFRASDGRTERLSRGRGSSPEASDGPSPPPPE